MKPALNHIRNSRQRKKSQRKRANAADSDDDGDERKKDKKLVFLSRSVLQKVRDKPMVTGTQIANEILEIYKQFCPVSWLNTLT